MYWTWDYVDLLLLTRMFYNTSGVLARNVYILLVEISLDTPGNNRMC